MKPFTCYVATVVLLATSTLSTADENVSASKPLLVWSGPDSQVLQASYHRVTSEKEWRKVWADHLGRTEESAFDIKLPTVNIDFNKCMVLAIFRGAAHNHRGVTIESITESADEVLVRFDYLTYQTAGPGGGAVSASAYGFVLLPISKKALVLAENVQGLKNQPAKWKERARFKSL